MLATGPFSALFNLPETVLNTSCRCVVPIPILDSFLTAFFPVVATAPGACASLSSPSMYSSDRSGKGPSTSNMGGVTGQPIDMGDGGLERMQGVMRRRRAV